MGLDITAYSRLVLDEKAVDQDEDGIVRVSVNDPGFAGRESPLIPGGFYRVTGESFRFRAGSYSGYNAWRAELCRFAFNCEPDAIWASPEQHAGRPFIEIVNFTDCDGAIGSIVAGKLYRDFAKFAERAMHHTDEQWRLTYGDFMKAFRIGSDAGLVKFH